jgi:uncharacterized protein (DUF1786 family)
MNDDDCIEFQHHDKRLKNRKGNQEWTIQRQWQHWVHNTKDGDKQNTENYKDEQHGPHQISGVNLDACEG